MENWMGWGEAIKEKFQEAELNELIGFLFIMLFTSFGASLCFGLSASWLVKEIKECREADRQAAYREAEMQKWRSEGLIPNTNAIGRTVYITTDSITCPKDKVSEK